jgi:hypothetical protein
VVSGASGPSGSGNYQPFGVNNKSVTSISRKPPPGAGTPSPPGGLHAESSRDGLGPLLNP